MNTVELTAQICNMLREETGLELTDEQAEIIQDVLFDSLVDIPDAWYAAQAEDAVNWDEFPEDF